MDLDGENGVGEDSVARSTIRRSEIQHRGITSRGDGPIPTASSVTAITDVEGKQFRKQTQVPPGVGPGPLPSSSNGSRPPPRTSSHRRVVSV